MVLDDHMSAEGGVVRHDNMVTDNAVMSDVHAHHKEAIGADRRYTASHGGAAMHGHLLANDISRADHEARRFTTVTGVLRRRAETGERRDGAAFSDFRAPVYDDMGLNAHAVTEPDFVTDQAVGTDLDAFTEARAGADNGRRMDQTYFRVSTSIAANSHSAASLSPTIPRPLNFTSSAGSLQLNLKPKDVTRPDWVSKPAIVDQHEEDDLPLWIDVPGLRHQQAACLRQGLNNEHPRHHRVTREVTREKRLVESHTLDAHQGLAGAIGLCPVNVEKRLGAESGA